MVLQKWVALMHPCCSQFIVYGIYEVTHLDVKTVDLIYILVMSLWPAEMCWSTAGLDVHLVGAVTTQNKEMYS